MLFKRYNDVSFLLSTIKWKQLPEFLTIFYEELLNDKLWQIYLSNPYRSTSFEEFKEKAINDSKPKEQVELEANQASNQALEMLDSIGGDTFGI